MNRIAPPFGSREGPFSLNSRPVLRVLRRKFASTVTSRPSEIHSRSIHYRLLVLLLLLVAGVLQARANEVAAPVGEGQIRAVQRKIQGLETQLENIRQQAETVRHRRSELKLGLELAQARVEEIRLTLSRSRDEILGIKEETSKLSVELEERRKLLAVNLQLAALLGKPGMLQLMWDALRGGHLEKATSVVLTLTRGQAALVAEYGRIRDARTHRMAELSRLLEKAGEEVRELQLRRSKLTELQLETDRRLRSLEKKQKSTGGELAELKQREAALERLFSVVSRTKRMIGKENILSYRGALPWPVKGRIVRAFGRHHLAKYATYTLCNGLRMRVETGEEIRSVFPGVVAFARFFKGYGNMVVMEHGHEVYSMIAGFSSIHVRLNQKVAMGTRLGLAGRATDEGNIYLEIRVKGKAQDPRRWLQLKQER